MRARAGVATNQPACAARVPHISTDTAKMAAFVYLEDVHETLKCIACEFPAVTPRIHGGCGALCCSGCLLPVEDHKCAASENLWYPGSQHPLIMKMLDDLKVSCGHTGCEEIFRRGDYYKHSKICNYEFFTCTMCKVELPRSCEIQHKKDCLERPTKCKFCLVDGSYMHIRSVHECPNLPSDQQVECPYCAKKGSATLIKRHETELSLCVSSGHLARQLAHPLLKGNIAEALNKAFEKAKVEYFANTAISMKKAFDEAKGSFNASIAETVQKALAEAKKELVESFCQKLDGFKKFYYKQFEIRLMPDAKGQVFASWDDLLKPAIEEAGSDWTESTCISHKNSAWFSMPKGHAMVKGHNVNALGVVEWITFKWNGQWSGHPFRDWMCDKLLPAMGFVENIPAEDRSAPAQPVAENVIEAQPVLREKSLDCVTEEELNLWVESKKMEVRSKKRKAVDAVTEFRIVKYNNYEVRLMPHEGVVYARWKDVLQPAIDATGCDYREIDIVDSRHYTYFEMPSGEQMVNGRNITATGIAQWLSARFVGSTHSYTVWLQDTLLPLMEAEPSKKPRQEQVAPIVVSDSYDPQDQTVSKYIAEVLNVVYADESTRHTIIGMKKPALIQYICARLGAKALKQWQMKMKHPGKFEAQWRRGMLQTQYQYVKSGDGLLIFRNV